MVAARGRRKRAKLCTGKCGVRSAVCFVTKNIAPQIEGLHDDDGVVLCCVCVCNAVRLTETNAPFYFEDRCEYLCSVANKSINM